MSSFTGSVHITEGALYVTIEAQYVATQTQKSLRRNMFLLFPVVPDVLHIVVIFHDLDELFHQLDVVLGLQLLVVLGNHFDLSGHEGVENRRKSELFKQFYIDF